jgi:hypothetical protein
LDPRIEGGRDLIVAVFRLAVADYLGCAYGHDAPGPVRWTRKAPFQAEARLFLSGAWAAYLADLIGLRSGAIWRESRLLNEAANFHNGSKLATAA